MASILSSVTLQGQGSSEGRASAWGPSTVAEGARVGAGPRLGSTPSAHCGVFLKCSVFVTPDSSVLSQHTRVLRADLWLARVLCAILLTATGRGTNVHPGSDPTPPTMHFA